ncbi:hypothetical protein ACFXPT_30595 [Streptomyces goshikiensis]|uniref:hypothetical protein n=1 Tax=Streptomyces goshikiensis TaxID=1942 RepID=UPI0036C10B66
MTYQDWTYHGIQDGPESSTDLDAEWQPARLLVEKPEFGPTQRENVQVLRELPEPNDGGFGWGYNGGGTSRAAALILADALELGDPDECGIGLCAYPENKALASMREDFCSDVLSQFCDRWRLRRSVVLRWAYAWHLQNGIVDLPAALRELPPFRVGYDR